MLNSINGEYRLDMPWLQKLQDFMGDVSGMYLFCIDKTGKQITEMSGDEGLLPRISAVINKHQVETMFKRVMIGNVEEQAIDNTEYSNVRLASIAVKANGEPLFCWFICGVFALTEGENVDEALLNTGSVLTEDKFIGNLDFLREISNKVYSSVGSNKNTSTSQTSTERELFQALRRSESLAEIVQLLELDEPYEDICDRLVDYVGRYSGIPFGYIVRPNIDGTNIEVLGRYVKEGADSNFEKSEPSEVVRMLEYAGDKPLVVSYKTHIDQNCRDWMVSAYLSSIVILPLFTSKPNRHVAMYAVFCDSELRKEWTREEIKFFGDAQRVLQSILEKRIQKNSLASSYKSLEAILDNVGSAIYVRDLDTQKILFENKSFKNIFAEERENGMIEKLFEEKLTDENGSSYFEIEYTKKKRWYDLHTTYIRWVDSRKVLLCSIFDVTDKKQYQQKIEQQANNDFLTGLYNRMSCERDLNNYLQQARSKNRKGAVLYLDLDDFKHINDGLGHQYGDVLLKSISNALQSINGVENTCYRMGGDEFIIIIPDTSYDRFEAIIEEIRVVFNKPWFLKGGDYYCTTSMGIVTFPEDDNDTVQSIIKKADIAMYEAKRGGKNRTSIYSGENDSTSSKRLDMEKSMRDATSNDYDEFEVYYQPIIDNARGHQCTGAEALIRWNSSSLGFVSPGDFIPLAEYLGLINPIGNYVLRKACETCKIWNESGHPYYKVNVNLSVVQLLQNDIVETVETIIRETEINPRNLTLEVTESLAINDMNRMKNILGKIKKLGCRIALDDFGTGYSSLSHIREIPLDVIKVDQSFVEDLAIDLYAQAFVKMVGELADALNVKVCVEGIETKEQLCVLEGMNVRLIQGFYFDKPMRQEDFEKKYVFNCQDNMIAPHDFFDPVEGLSPEDRAGDKLSNKTDNLIESSIKAKVKAGIKANLQEQNAMHFASKIDSDYEHIDYENPTDEPLVERIKDVSSITDDIMSDILSEEELRELKEESDN